MITTLDRQTQRIPPGWPAPRGSAAIHVQWVYLDPGGILMLSAHIIGREILEKFREGRTNMACCFSTNSVAERMAADMQKL